MNLSDHLDKNNLHHAYLIEGQRDEILPEILILMKELDIATVGNPDFFEITLDSFKIDDARNLKSFSNEKNFSSKTTGKKIFIISANNFLLEAQGALLKIFEEPNKNTHFFVILPDINVLLPTLVSRFFIIHSKEENKNELLMAQNFVSFSIPQRISFIKEMLSQEEKINIQKSNRSEIMKFLNALEKILHQNLMKNRNFYEKIEKSIKQIFKVREFLRQPGSSAKSLMESLAIIIPRL